MNDSLWLYRLFQHTAARRRLVALPLYRFCKDSCFNTQPPEGGWNRAPHNPSDTRGFNTQPPEGGWRFGLAAGFLVAGFNTQPPEGGWGLNCEMSVCWCLFQHTAARRRLVLFVNIRQIGRRFNTQPPEGGWSPSIREAFTTPEFQHTAARRRLAWCK